MSRSFNFLALFVIFTFSMLFSIIGTQFAYSQCSFLCMQERGGSSAWDGGWFSGNKYGFLLGPSYEIAFEDSDYTEADVIDDNLLLAANDGDLDTTYLDAPSNKWHFAIIPYLWMMGLNGKAGIKGKTANLNVSFSDIIKNLDLAVQVHMEAWRDKFGFFIDTTYSKIALSDNVNLRSDRSLRIKDTTEFFLGEIGGFYRVGTWPVGRSADNKDKKTDTSITLDVIGGGRYWWLENQIDIKGLIGVLDPQASGSKSWFDFIAGGRVILDINKFFVSLRSDIGGFGLGFSSDISWNIAGNIGYELPWYKITPIIGYRALYDKYSDGSGDNRFLWDAWMYGPQIGVALQF